MDMLTQPVEPPFVSSCSMMTAALYGCAANGYEEYSMYSPNEVMGGYYSRKC